MQDSNHVCKRCLFCICFTLFVAFLLNGDKYIAPPVFEQLIDSGALSNQHYKWPKQRPEDPAKLYLRLISSLVRDGRGRDIKQMIDFEFILQRKCSNCKYEYNDPPLMSNLLVLQKVDESVQDSLNLFFCLDGNRFDNVSRRCCSKMDTTWQRWHFKLGDVDFSEKLLVL